MPELPEIETIARQLAPRLCGQPVRRLRLLDEKLRRPQPPPLAGRRILSVRRAGKQLAIELSARPGEAATLWMGIHLRMTGQLTYREAAAPSGRHLRAVLDLGRGHLLFTDPRRFGVFSYGRRVEELWPAGALDPLSPEFSASRLATMLRTSAQPIKPWLLRQDRLLGLGNYLASEILFAAGIGPRRRANRLRPAETARLHAAALERLQAAIAMSGATLSDYRDAHGEGGAFQNFLAVYGRRGQPCRACGAAIRRLIQAGRSTFYCPRCQGGGAARAASHLRRPTTVRKEHQT